MQQLLGVCCCAVTILLWLAFGVESYCRRRRNRVPADPYTSPLPMIVIQPLTIVPEVAVEVMVDDDTGCEEKEEEWPVHILPTAPDEPIHFLADCRMRPADISPLVEASAITSVLDEVSGIEPASRPKLVRRLGLHGNSVRRGGRRPFQQR